MEESITQFNFGAAFIKMLLSLGLLCALVVGAAWLLRKVQRGRVRLFNETTEIKILERRQLSAKSALLLVEVNGKRILVGESAESMRALAEIPSNQEVPTPTFEQVLNHSAKL